MYRNALILWCCAVSHRRAQCPGGRPAEPNCSRWSFAWPMAGCLTIKCLSSTLTHSSIVDALARHLISRSALSRPWLACRNSCAATVQPASPEAAVQAALSMLVGGPPREPLVYRSQADFCLQHPDVTDPIVQARFSARDVSCMMQLRVTALSRAGDERLVDETAVLSFYSSTPIVSCTEGHTRVPCEITHSSEVLCSTTTRRGPARLGQIRH